MQATHNTHDALQAYFDDIQGSSPLSREAESRLAARIRAGDHSARNTLVEANLRFVVTVAKGYQCRGLSLQELISAGNMGLMRAVERFDETRGFKFISYAVWWVRQAIQEALADVDQIRKPTNRISLLHGIERIRGEHARHGRSPAVCDLADELGVSEGMILDTLEKAQCPVRLDSDSGGFSKIGSAGHEGEPGQEYIDTIPDENQPPPDEGINRRELREQVGATIAQLDERERYILQRYFGLDGEQPATLEEIGGRMGLTRERARQIKERALEKLRRPGQYAALQQLCG